MHELFLVEDTKSQIFLRSYTWHAVASWFVTLTMHVHADSSPAWGIVRTGPLASVLTLSFFGMSCQCLKMRVLGVDVET